MALQRRRQMRARFNQRRPPQMFSRPAVALQLPWQSERIGIENNWYSLTGRVVAVKIEADGDLHLAVQDTTGDKPGIVVC